MSTETFPLTEYQEAPSQATGKWAACLAHSENITVSFALGLMVILPLAEALLRRTLHVSIVTVRR